MTDIQSQIDRLFAEALNHFRAGRTRETETLAAEILALQPKLAQTLHLMGVIALQADRLDQARTLIERALALEGHVATFHNTLGEVYRSQGKFEKALVCYERALALDPYPLLSRARSNIDHVLKMCGERIATAHYLRQAEAHPADADVLADLGDALNQLGAIREAAMLYRQALALNGNMPNTLCNLGLMLNDLGHLDEAIEHYNKALALRPDDATFRANLGFTLLLKGDYAQGWPLHEYRLLEWKLKRRFSNPAWQGEDLQGRRILLHSEQGFGDTLQFVRFAPLVAARGGQVVLEVKPPLIRLLATLDKVAEIVPAGTAVDDIAWHCPLMSLPMAFGTTLDNLPASTPYVMPATDLLTNWRARIGARSGLKVGLAWRGQPTHRRDRDRSIPPALLAPLAQIAGVSYFALQKLATGSGYDELPEALRQGDVTTDLAPGFTDYADTAAAIMALDLVITVDTSVAHLAGALAKPVWILLHKVPDWRWGESGEQSPWYPTARLFRQFEAGDYVPVIADVVTALKTLADQHI